MPKTWVMGSRLTFLQSRGPAYLEAVKAGKSEDFLNKTYAEYFDTYHYLLGNGVEPSPDVVYAMPTTPQGIAAMEQIMLERRKVSPKLRNNFDFTLTNL